NVGIPSSCQQPNAKVTSRKRLPLLRRFMGPALASEPPPTVERGAMSISAPSSSSSASSSSVESSTSHAAAAAAYAHSQGLRRSRSLPRVSAIARFPSIRVTPEEQAHYDRVVGRLLYRAVQEYEGYAGAVDTKRWAFVRRKKCMAIYRSLHGASHPDLTLMLGVGDIDGSLEDVMDGVYAENATEVRCVKAFLKSKVIAGTLMHVSERRSPDDPFNFAGIKWFASKSPGGPMTYDRDLLTYERQGVTLDADGEEIAYHLLQSIDRPEWPANTFKSLIRSYCSICYLYKRKGSRVETFFFGEFYGSGSFPQRISDYSIAGKWLSVVNAAECSEARKLTQLRRDVATNSSRSSNNSVTMCERTACNGCQEEKSTLFSTYYVCAGCQQEKKLFELDKAGRRVSDRFCNKCIAKVAAQRGSKIYWDGAFEEVETHAPPYLDHMFQHFSSLSSTERALSDAASSENSAVFSDMNFGSSAAYFSDGLSSFARADMESTSSFASSCSEDTRARGESGPDDTDARRRQSRADRLSTSSYTKEQLDFIDSISPAATASPMSVSSSSVSESTSVEATQTAYRHRRSRFSRHQPSVESVSQFPHVDVTPHEQAHYDRVVGRLFFRAVREYSSYHARTASVDLRRWTPVRSNASMAIYRSAPPVPANPRVSLMLGVGKIDGSLEDVMDGVYSESPAELRTVMTFLKSKFIVGTVLQASDRRTQEHPFNFAGLKWFASKTPGGRVSCDRDLLYYERQGMTFDSQGHEVAYHLMQSVDRPEWPANTFKNLIRSHSSICYLYKRKGSRVETFFFGEFYDSGHFPQKLADFALAGKWLSVVNAVKCSEARKLSQLRARHSSNRASTVSITISDIFCSEERELFELDRDGRPVKDRFCNKCLAEAAKQRGSAIPLRKPARPTAGSSAPSQPPPAYFQYAFHLCDPYSEASVELPPRGYSSGLLVDTSYLDGLLRQESRVAKDASGLDDENWESYSRRRQSHFESLSTTTSETKEKLLAELFTD
ncbi:hypothetical protein PybrP1_010621, partial [[Pythium] brassicae (nom. inval.)]